MASVAPAALNGHSGSDSIALSAAQKLMQKHEAHNPTIEEVPDEEDLKPHGAEPISSSILEAPGDEPAPGWVQPVSAKAAGKRKEEIPTEAAQPSLDISEEAFPALGGMPTPKQPAVINSNWKNSNKTPNGTNGVPSNGASTPASGVNTPPPATIRTPLGDDPRKLKIPGQVKEDYFLAKDYMLPRQALKKPLPETLKDFNKKSRKVTVTHSAGANGTTFSAAGPSREACQQALKDILLQVGAKVCRICIFTASGTANDQQVTTKASIPQSARAHIIGKQGSKVKEIQEKTGAKITIPKLDDAPHPTEEDDDPVINIILEGNAHSVAEAKLEIQRIAGERTATVNTKLRTIPAEFYPFIEERQSGNGGVNVRIPQHYTYKGQQPATSESGKPIFLPAADDDHITLSGERSAVQGTKAEIESLAEELHRKLTIDHLPIGRNKHQFIIGNRGISPEDFYKETGCAIILPSDADNEYIKIIGPPSQTDAARQRAFQLVTTMQQDNFNAVNQFRGEQDAKAHVANLAQYLRQRKIIEHIERLHKSQIVADEAVAWAVFSRDLQDIMNTKKDISSILQAHPPSRFATLQVNPFFYRHLQNNTTPRVKREFGVHLVTPNQSDADTPVVLVFEGEGGLEPNYEAPRGQPSPEQVRAFKQGLEDAKRHILDLIAAQGELTSTSIEVPHM
jgi:rRNA processing protein Krr1/Pno1